VNRRQIILIVCMIVTLLLVWRVSQQDDAPEAVEAVSHASGRAVRMSAAPETKSAAVSPTQIALPDRGLGEGDLFPEMSWRPPPPPPPPPVPPPPPTAPPLPFSYLGQWQEGKGMTFFLSEGGKLYSVHQGEVVTQWRLDEFGRGFLTFTYLPMNKQQTIRFAQ